MEILRFHELPHSNNSIEFEGVDHGGAGVSFFVVDAAPGRGPSLHEHPYAEVELNAGQVVVVPAGEPHGFTAAGDGSKQVNIHASPRFVTEWLETESYGR